MVSSCAVVILLLKLGLVSFDDLIFNLLFVQRSTQSDMWQKLK